jgi:hypothetical protein
MYVTRMATSRLENSAQVTSPNLKFVHRKSFWDREVGVGPKKSQFVNLHQTLTKDGVDKKTFYQDEQSQRSRKILKWWQRKYLKQFYL